MTVGAVTNIATQLLGFHIGRPIPADNEFLLSEGAIVARDEGLILQESRTPLCPEHDVPCGIKHEADGLFAYHTEVVRHRFPIKDTDTYHYVINYPRFFAWFVHNGLNFECQESDVRNDNFLVWAPSRCSEETENLILVPASKEGTVGRLCTLLGELRAPRSSLIVTYDSIQKEHGTAIELLSGGFATCCRAQDLGNDMYRDAMLKLSLFRGRVERAYVNLHELALGQIDFGLNVETYVEESGIAAALFNALHTEDWKEFEKLCRYVVSRLMPSALHGYGEGDAGRLPDSVGILPNDKNEPDHFVLFDAKSLASLAKAKFAFGRGDPAKYADYVETADRMGRHAYFGDVTLLFVAPSFSSENAANFASQLSREIGRRGISRHVEIEFLTLEALTVLFLVESDTAQAIVMKGKDPTGEFGRLLFSPGRLISHLSNQSVALEGFPQLTQHKAVIVNEMIVQSLLAEFYGGGEQYAAYFEKYRELAQGK